MKTVDEVIEVIGKIPYMTREQAVRMTDLIRENRLERVLELGFYHGASTSFIANAVSGFANGSVVCIDKERARTMEPNVEGLLERLGLRDRARVHYEPTSYLWRLMKMLEEHPEPVFDLCYLDGAHNWFVDGFAFFLVDRLLKPGGWIILDDLNWRYEDSPTFRGSETLRNMPVEERECFQLRNVFELLIQRHPAYGKFREEGNWAYAQKLPGVSAVAGAGVGAAQLKTLTVVKETKVGMGEALIKLGRRLGMR